MKKVGKHCLCALNTVCWRCTDGALRDCLGGLQLVMLVAESILGIVDGKRLL